MVTKETFRHRVELAQENQGVLKAAELEAGFGAQTAAMELQDLMSVPSSRTWCLVLHQPDLPLLCLSSCLLSFRLITFTVCHWIVEMCSLLLYFTETHSLS